MYTHTNFKTKKALKEAVARGDMVTIFTPGYFAQPNDGVHYVEGPHYPAPHSWYAEVIVDGGKVVKVK